ncbi:MAG: hypothetical protein PVG22_08610 [Chromatiales bacterium]|jgi:hypothetical protein
MILLATILGLTAASVLVMGGYLLGAKKALGERKHLRDQVMHQAKERQRLRELVSHGLQNDSDALDLRKDLINMTQALVSQSDAVNRMLEPLNKREAELESLLAVIEQALTPLKQREQLAYELSTLNADVSDRSHLVSLLDQIAEKGQFWAVSLHDDQGLLLAASRNTKNLNQLTAISAMVLLFTDRIGRSGAPMPLSMLIHDEANMATLSRIFHVGEQRLLLSAVATGSQLSATALDPALAKLGSVLSPIQLEVGESL